VRVSVHIRAAREAFAGLHYDNPGRRAKICLNSKLAYCELTVEARGQPVRRFVSVHGAAFEILSDEDRSGVPLLV